MDFGPFGSPWELTDSPGPSQTIFEQRLEIYDSLAFIHGFTPREVDEMYLWEIGGLIRKHNNRIEGKKDGVKVPNKSGRDFAAERIAWIQAGSKPEDMPMPDDPEPSGALFSFLQQTALQ